MKRYLSSPFFLIALLCFFLPFFAVTCAGLGGFGGVPGADEAEEATTLTGVEFLTGQAEEDLEDPEEITGGGFPGSDLFPIPGPSPSIPLPTEPEAAAEQAVDLGTSQIWAIAAAAIALLGLFLALLAGRAGGVMALVLGAAGAVVLFLLAGSVKSAIDDAVGAEAAGIIQVENKMGFWLALGAFIVAAVTGLIRLLLPERPAGPPPEAGASGFEPTAPPPGTPPAPPPPASPPQ